MKTARRIVLATLLGGGCAAHSDRAAVAPPEVVSIPADLDPTCGAAPRDRFAYDSAPSDATCDGVDEDAKALELDARAPAAQQARAVAEFLAGEPADPPVDRRTLATAVHTAGTADE